MALLIGCAGVTSSRCGDPTLPEFLAARLTKDPVMVGSKEKKALTVDEICAINTDPYARRVFAEYGAMFAADVTVAIPWRCVYEMSDEVLVFQKTLKTRSAPIDGVAIDLQEAAMTALSKAEEEAAAEQLRIIPFDGAIAGRRSYYDTISLWGSRFFPALDYWVSKGAIPEADAVTARSLPVRKQVERVVEWETAGFYFGTTRTRSIFSSTAPPGTSQHLSLIAFDVQNYSDPKIIEILAANGWYQTIINDPTHFTYLGVKASELPSRGLTQESRGNFTFWVPRL